MSARKSLTVENCNKSVTSCRLGFATMDRLSTLSTLDVENLELAANSRYAKRVPAGSPTRANMVNGGLVTLMPKMH